MLAKSKSTMRNHVIHSQQILLKHYNIFSLLNKRKGNQSNQSYSPKAYICLSLLPIYSTPLETLAAPQKNDEAAVSWYTKSCCPDCAFNTTRLLPAPAITSPGTSDTAPSTFPCAQYCHKYPPVAGFTSRILPVQGR